MKLQPEHLKLIRTVALEGARGIRASGHECAAVILLFNSTPDNDIGDMTAAPMPYDKDRIAAIHQKLARDPSIAAALLIQEGWQTIVSPDEPIPTTSAGDPLRQEILLLNLLTKTDQWILSAEIHDNRIDDAEFIHVDAETYTGRFIREPQS